MAKSDLKFRVVPQDYGRKLPQIVKLIGTSVNVLLIIAMVTTFVYTRYSLNLIQERTEQSLDLIQIRMDELKQELTTTPEEAAIKEMLDKKASYLSHRDRIHLSQFILEESRSRDFDINIAAALINHESRYDPLARSHKGALGLMQVMPLTGEWMADSIGLPWDGEVTLLNPFANVFIGLEYLSYLRTELKGSMEKALVAYERGPAYAKRGGLKQLTPYANAILAAAKNFPIAP